MNDRGLKLTPADMLKGYLLANMEDGKPRTKANDLWRKRLRSLDEHADDAGSDFLKTWLRSQYSTKIRERKKGARPEDWDRIGTEFHRWLRGAHDSIGLKSREDFYQFVVRDLDFYSHQYERILEGIDGSVRPGQPAAVHPLQRRPRLHPPGPAAAGATAGRRQPADHRPASWRSSAGSPTSCSPGASGTSAPPPTRRCSTPCSPSCATSAVSTLTDLAKALRDYLLKVDETFDSNDDLYVHQQNRGQLHKILARITDYITVGSGQASTYIELTNGAKVKYEVEHIWADHPERHTDEFSPRGRLRPPPQPDRRPAAAAQAVQRQLQRRPLREEAAALLQPEPPRRQPEPAELREEPRLHGLHQDQRTRFKPYEQFKAADVIERGNLYREIAKQVWNPTDLLHRRRSRTMRSGESGKRCMRRRARTPRFFRSIRLRGPCGMPGKQPSAPCRPDVHDTLGALRSVPGRKKWLVDADLRVDRRELK